LPAIAGPSRIVRRLAERAPPRGTVERRAAGVLSIALGTTQLATAARKVLAEVDQDDIRIRAGEILGKLLEEEA
jgi:hypothetical protein